MESVYLEMTIPSSALRALGMARFDWYYVSHLIPGDVLGEERPFEVQVLGEHGAALAVGYFTDDCDHLKVAGCEVPPEVLNAGKRYPLGFGDYVDASGNRLDGWGNPVAPEPLDDRERLAALLLGTAERLIGMPSPDVPGGVRRLRAIVTHYGETQAAADAERLLCRYE